MPLTDVGLCARALLRLGARPIQTFLDDTPEAELANALYGVVRDALLSAYPWRFATLQVSLVPLAAPPAADYAYAFQLPSNFLRAISVGVAGRGRGVAFRLAKDQIHCGESAITLTYLYRPEEASLPPFFEQVLIARLSAEFCLPLTEQGDRAAMLYKLADQEFERAKRIDAHQDTPRALEDFSLINARS
jgi:hypothetical protein